MTSPLISFIGSVKTIWEALAPPDVAAAPYREIASAVLAGSRPRPALEGSHGHRIWRWMIPERAEPIAESGAAQTETSWQIVAQLFLGYWDRTIRGELEAVIKESVLLRRAIDKYGTWPAGVINVALGALEYEETPEGVIVIYPFTVITQEAD